MLELLRDFLVKILGYVLPFTIRWYFTPERIAAQVKIRLSPDGDGVEFFNSELPTASASVVITNMSPFTIELERAYRCFVFNNDLGHFVYLKKHSIKPASEAVIYIRQNLARVESNYVHQKQKDTSRAAIRFSANFNCRVNNFQVEVPLQTSHFKLVNYHVAF